MGETTGIEWCDSTFNAWWGCVEVSEQCRHCYARIFARSKGQDVWGPLARRRFLSEDYWKNLGRWNGKAMAEGRRWKVFCGSMCDIAEILLPDHPDADDMHAARQALFQQVTRTPFLIYLFVTKRPENLPRLVPKEWLLAPPHNVCYLTSVGTQADAEKQIPALLRMPARVHGVSCEPLLGKLNLRPVLGPDRVNWVIGGGESGPLARPTDLEWAQDLLSQCSVASVPFFWKQWGEWLPVPYEEADEWEGRKAFRGTDGSVFDGAARGGRNFIRVGRKAAGKLLDGLPWQQFPEGLQ